VIVLFGFIIIGGITLLWKQTGLDPYYWMLWIGIGMFLPYIAIQTTVFERMIALFKIRANAGFFVYILDSAGYLISVGLLVYKEFFISKLSWTDLLVYLNVGGAVSGVGLVALANHFLWKHKVRSK
jgi:hypothetical protein